MRVPDFRRYQHWLQGLGLLISGMVIGGAVFMSIYHHNLDLLLTKSRSLQSELENLKEANKQAEHSNKQNTAVRSIEVLISNPASFKKLEEVTETEIRTETRKTLKFLIGQPIASLTPEMIKQLYGRKIIILENKTSYAVEIDSVFNVQGQLRIWIRAKEYAGI